MHFTKRHSKKAKYLQIRILPKGIEVVIPHRYKINDFEILDFLSKKEQWIQNALKKSGFVEEVIDKGQSNQNTPLPEQVDFVSMNESWQIRYLPTEKKRLCLLPNVSGIREIVLIGNIGNQALVMQKIKSWIAILAKDFLAEQLNLLSQQTKLLYRNLTIRNNRTRWGSCSSSQDISLSFKLLFLPPRLTRHVLLHELCHTKVMNHGMRFWNLLEKYDEAARIHAKELKTIQLPRWLIT